MPYKGRRPTLEKELAELLVRWALPDASDAEVQRILQQRGQSASRHEAVLSEEHENAVKELADEDEQATVSQALKSKRSANENPADIEDTRNRDPSSPDDVAEPPCGGPVEGPAGHETPRADGQGPSGHGADIGVGGSSGSGGASKLRLVDIANKEYSAADARALLPSAPGCTISINKNERWQVKYEGRLVAPRSWSQCWHANLDGRSYMDVLRRAIAWAWQCHEETCPGSDCPFDLSGVS